MNQKKLIHVDYVSRVQGETAIRIELEAEPAIELKVFEPPRFFEGFLVGRKYDEIGDIVSRICGICPVSHMTAAILAIEKAMDIEVTPQTRILRKLMCISQIAASHLVHLYMLAMPDYFGYSGIAPMLPGFRREVKRLVKVKEALNDLTTLIGGRALHPVTHMVGGFTRIPEKDEFLSILKRLQAVKNEACEVVKDVARFQVPDLHCETEYMALDSNDEYAINEGRIRSTAGLDATVEEYPRQIDEFQVPHAFAKQAKIKSRGSFMVGALARLHLKFARLQPETRMLAREVGFTLPNTNPFYNNLAQSLEVFDGVLRCMQLLETQDFREEERSVRVKPGEGGSMIEAPRGLLYHWYSVNGKGIVEQANIITPTSQNFLNMEQNMRKLVQDNLDRSRDEIRQLSEQLIRAYDPCFSCSVH